MQDQIKTVLSIFEHGPQTIVYILDQRIKTVGMTILPTELKDLFSLEGKWNVDSLVQLKLVGDGYASGYSQGHIMHGSESSMLLKYVRQEAVEAEGERRIETVLQSDRVTAYHVLRLRADVPSLFVETRIENTSGEIQRIEYLTSFSLCDLSPVGEEERIGDLVLYRLTSRWSGEGKLLRQSMLDLHMEPSWSRHGVNAVRYGQVGSMPVRGYFPWGVVEDEKYGWCLGAQIYHPGSWQMEIWNKDDKISFAGGLADREFGHFLKTLRPGEIFIAPKAVIAAAMGGVDEVSHCLTLAQEEALSSLPEAEMDLPIVFNEYCTTWGNPTAKNLSRMI